MNAQLASLSALEHACAELASCQDLEDVLRLQGKAEAVAAYFEVVERGSDAHALAWGLVQVSERRIGELTREIPKAKPGRKPKAEAGKEIQPVDEQKSKSDQLAELNLSRRRVQECERAAALPQDEWRARVEAGQAAIRDGDRPKPVHASSSAVGYESDECSTPPEYVELVRATLGGVIGCDPFSNAYAQNIVQAQVFYTKQDSAFGHQWASSARNVFYQPPYSPALIKQATTEYHAQREARVFDESVGLVNSCTETGWFQSLLDSCDAVCFPGKRIQFWYRGEPIKGSNRFAQTFFYTGPAFKKFVRTFSPIGAVLVSHNRRPRP